jgi:hypothetical protein
MFKRKKVVAKHRAEQTVLLRDDTLKKLDVLLRDTDSGKHEELSIELYHTIREFFEGYFNLKYEFTYEELIDEIKHKRGILEATKGSLIKFARTMLAKEYSEQKISSPKEIKLLVKDMKKVVSLLIPDEEEADVKKNIVHEIMKTLKNIRLRPRSTNEDAVKIFQLIDRARPLLTERDATLAKQHYKKAMMFYKGLKSQNKAEVYEELGKLYRDIITLEVQKKLKEMNKALVEVNDLINVEKISHAKLKYKQLLNMYLELPEMEQKKVYSNVMQFYEKLNK